MNLCSLKVSVKIPSVRKIIHIDMDCFYAAVEMRDRPELAGKPVAVGGSSKRGVLTTCNYEARKYGCRSALPGFKARELCPDLIILPIDFEKYTRESARIKEIFQEYTDLVESVSLDEAFLDVTHIKDRYAWDIAKEIRARIFETTSLTASAGVAPNKMLAKIASDWRKPNGQFAILPEDVEAFMKPLSVSKIWGVGKKTQERLATMGIQTCGELQELGKEELEGRFGKFGSELYELCRGMDDRSVVPQRIRKSMSTERTFQDDLVRVVEAVNEMALMCEELQQDFKNSRHREREIAKIFVKLKFSDFQTTTKECVASEMNLSIYETLLSEAWERGNGKVRLIGVGIRFSEDREEAEPSPSPQLSLAIED